jgi:hypothetical protein
MKSPVFFAAKFPLKYHDYHEIPSICSPGRIAIRCQEWRSSPRLASAFLKKWRGSAGTLLEVIETMTRQAVDACQLPKMVRFLMDHPIRIDDLGDTPKSS